MKKFLLLASICAITIVSFAQSPTTVTNTSNCNVFRTFTTSDEGFSSPSIYSDANDVSFNWSQSIGAEVETSGLANRTASLISPIYSLATQGQAIIGFKYAVPAGTQYRIRIIAANSPIEILATTANGGVYSNFANTNGNLCLQLFDQDLVAGTSIRFEFTFRVANHPNEDILFDDLAISVNGGPLPVTFEGFVARKNTDNSIKLLWNVGDEINVRGYSVENSMDGNVFNEAGFVTATGNAVYSFNYDDKINGTSYFRIKNVDFDGKVKYSGIIKVFGKDVIENELKMYPLPAKDYVIVQHNKANEKAFINLYSNDGKMIMQKLVRPSTLQTQLNFPNIGKGLYIVRYDDGTGVIQSKTLIKN